MSKIIGKADYSSFDIEISFEAESVENHYGVPNSPVWYEWTEFDPVSVSILGVEVKFEDLPDNLQEAILALPDELEFEVDE